MTDGEKSIYDVDSQFVALEVMNMANGQKSVLGFMTRGVSPGYDDYGLRPRIRIDAN